MTRLPTIFFVLGLPFAGTASADPINDRYSVKAEFETAYAPAPEGDSVVVAGDPARASNRDAGTQGGNPLWKIPLSALTATRERPLFSASRRPPALAVQTAAPPPPQDPAPAAPAPQEGPALKLIGTIVSPATRIAVVRDSATQAVTRLRVGEGTSGWRVKTVNLRSIVVEKGEQSAILGLPEPRVASGEHPAPNSPPPRDRTSRR